MQIHPSHGGAGQTGAGGRHGQLEFGHLVEDHCITRTRQHTATEFHQTSRHVAVLQQLRAIRGDAAKEDHIGASLNNELAASTQHHLVTEGHFARGLHNHVAFNIDTLAKGHVLDPGDRQSLQISESVHTQREAGRHAVEVAKAGSVGAEHVTDSVATADRDQLHITHHAVRDGDASGRACARAAGQAHVVVNAIAVALAARAECEACDAIADAAVDGDGAACSRQVQHISITYTAIDTAGDGQCSRYVRRTSLQLHTALRTHRVCDHQVTAHDHLAAVGKFGGVAWTEDFQLHALQFACNQYLATAARGLDNQRHRHHDGPGATTANCDRIAGALGTEHQGWTFQASQQGRINRHAASGAAQANGRGWVRWLDQCRKIR